MFVGLHIFGKRHKYKGIQQKTNLIVQVLFRWQVYARGFRNTEVDSHTFFYLEDLWESFTEWSAYGRGVPLLLNGRDPIQQYYVPYLSGIQLYINPSKASTRIRSVLSNSARLTYLPSVLGYLTSFHVFSCRLSFSS